MFLNLENIKAVIFDLDGTIVHDKPYHERAYQIFMKNPGGVYLRKILLDL